MIPYILLIIISGLFCFAAFGKNKTSVCLGLCKETKYNNLALPVFFLILFLMIAFRGISVGTDTSNYRSIFNEFRKGDIRNFLVAEPEVLFKILNWIVGRFTDNYNLYLVITTVIIVLPIAVLYCQDRSNSYLKIILFVNQSVFIMMFSGIRQSIAIAIAVIAYKFVRERKPLPFIIACIVALGFHHSAFIIAFMYPLYHFKLKKHHLLPLIPCVICVFVFNKQVFSIITNVLKEYLEEKVDLAVTETGAITALMMFVIFAVISFLLPDEKLIDSDINGLRNYLLFAVMIQCFSPIHTLAMRMNYYYILFIPILIPRILEITKIRYKQLSFYLRVIMIIFFTLYFFYNIYIANSNGTGLLNTVPYIPFWAE